MSKTSFLLALLLLGVVLFITPTSAHHHKPPHGHKPPSTEEESLETLDGKPPKYNPPPKYTPPPKHKPPTPLDEPSKEEASFPEHKPIYKPTKGKGKNPPHGHHPGHPPVENIEDSHKPPVHKYPPKKSPHKPPTSN